MASTQGSLRFGGPLIGGNPHFDMPAGDGLSQNFVPVIDAVTGYHILPVINAASRPMTGTTGMTILTQPAIPSVQPPRMTFFFAGQWFVPQSIPGNEDTTANINVGGLAEARQIWLDTPLTAAITGQVESTATFGNVEDGAEFRFTRTLNSTGAFAWNIGYGSGNATIKALSMGQWCVLRFVASVGYLRLAMAGSL